MLSLLRRAHGGICFSTEYDKVGLAKKKKTIGIISNVVEIIYKRKIKRSKGKSNQSSGVGGSLQMFAQQRDN